MLIFKYKWGCETEFKDIDKKFSILEIECEPMDPIETIPENLIVIKFSTHIFVFLSCFFQFCCVLLNLNF